MARVTKAAPPEVGYRAFRSRPSRGTTCGRVRVTRATPPRSGSRAHFGRSRRESRPVRLASSRRRATLAGCRTRSGRSSQAWDKRGAALVTRAVRRGPDAESAAAHQSKTSTNAKTNTKMHVTRSLRTNMSDEWWQMFKK